MTARSFLQTNYGASFYKPEAPRIDWDDPLSMGLALDLAFSAADADSKVVADNSSVTGSGLVTSGPNQPTWGNDPVYGSYMNFPGPQSTVADNGSVSLTNFKQRAIDFPYQAARPWSVQLIVRIVPDNVNFLGILSASAGLPEDMDLRQSPFFGGGSAFSCRGQSQAGGSVEWLANNFFNSNWINAIVTWDPAATTEARFWKNGAAVTPFGGPSSLSGTPNSMNECLIGYAPSASNRSNMIGDMALCRIWSRVLNDHDVRQLSDNPWAIYLPEDHILYPTVQFPTNPQGIRTTSLPLGVRHR